jgi:hypothetical protein
MAVCLAPAAVVGQTVELRRFACGTFEASGVGGLFVVSTPAGTR